VLIIKRTEIKTGEGRSKIPKKSKSRNIIVDDLLRKADNGGEKGS